MYLRYRAVGGGGPDIVIARREVERDLAVGREGAFELPPLRFGGGVVEALDHVADGEDERGLGGGRLAPDALPDAGLGFARAVAEDDEVEIAGRGAPPGERQCASDAGRSSSSAFHAAAGSRDETVAYAAHGQQVARLGGIVFDVAAQAAR